MRNIFDGLHISRYRLHARCALATGFLAELMEPSSVFFDFEGYDFAEGQPVRIIKRIDEYAQQGWSGDVKLHLASIEGDIYDQSIE